MSDPNFSPNASTPGAGPAAGGAPAMSTPETLTSIFFEPGRTFEALRERPRFLVAALIIAGLTLLFTVLLFQKIDFEQFMRQQIEKGPRAEQMTPEQKEQAVAFQTGTVGKTLAYGFPLLGTAIYIAAGAAIYLLGAMLMGGALRYKQALAVWAYSSLPPTLLFTLVALVLLFIKPSDEVDVTKPGGIVSANLGAVLGSNASPPLAAALGSLDLFAIYGLILAAIGMRKVGRLSSGSAWAVVIGAWLLGVVVKVCWAALFGRAA